jgi:2-dehydro-3-deoxyphosphogluconate aldolase/(4S)-4-hydroxy-2-oxoglutarate aldolase
VVDRALARSVDVIPRVATATEVQRAPNFRITEVKFFPAEAMGGLRTVRALADAFPTVPFVASGGTRLHNAAEHLAGPAA